MKTKQTAMQELIHWLKIGWKDEDINTVLKKANQLLEVEKEQIKDAHLDGQSLVSCKDEYAEDYYNETYNKQDNG